MSAWREENAGAAAALAGCPATLSGWHVPEPGRVLVLATTFPEIARVQIIPETAPYGVLTGGPRTRRQTCLCGWRPTEEAVMAIAELERQDREARRTFSTKRDRTSA